MVDIWNKRDYKAVSFDGFVEFERVGNVERDGSRARQAGSKSLGGGDGSTSYRRTGELVSLRLLKDQNNTDELPMVTSFSGLRTRYSTQGRATIPLPSTKIFVTGMICSVCKIH